MRQKIWLVALSATGLATSSLNAQPLQAGDPPGRIGRLAFVNGTVSFHDNQQTDWGPAVVNTPLTSGDALWTEPNAKSEISIAGTRVRMDSATELDMLAIDDTQTRMQLAQGRVDIKTFTYDTNQPYTIVTPRGVITLQQQGDYYVLAGSTEDPTELGVRQGAAQIQASNGQVLAVRAGEIGVVSGDGASPRLETMHQAPPPMPTYWAQRDQQVTYAQPQYLSAEVTGYEDMAAYGSWSNDPDYGQVWVPNNVAADWQPYSTGRWAYEAPYGWTWVDEQPWGFAPYHYGRWAHRGDRWMWVAPQRDVRPVYAPALVAFVGGVELGVALGAQSREPVGWFPLGPREVYVPPYTQNRDYYRRLNMSARVEDRILEDRWQRAERHEALRADEQMANRRFTTVVPAQSFTRSEPVARVALKVDPQKLSTVAVAPVAAPPSPKAEIRAGAQVNGQAQQPNQARPGQAPQPGQAQRPNEPARAGAIETIGRPTAAEAPKREAPGPKVAAHTNATGNVQGTAQTQPGGKPALPQLAPRNPDAPKPVTAQGQQQDNKAQPNQAQQPAKPAEPAKPGEAKPAQPNQAQQPGTLPPARTPQATTRPEPPRPNEAQRPNAPQQQPQRANEPQRPEQAQRPNEPPRATPATPATPPTGTQQRATPATPATPSPNAQQPPDRSGAVRPIAPQPQAPHQAEAPRPQPQQQAQPRHQEPPHQQQAAPAPQPQHVAPQPQQQAQQPHPQPAPQQQAQQPHPQPQPAQQQQHQQQAQQPAPQQHPPQEQKKDEKKDEKK